MADQVMPMLILKDIHKSFGEVDVLKGISVTINKGELITFVGPSGCGKTTLLRIVGGFTKLTSGQVILDGVDISSLPPDQRPTKMVFQNYALFPHMTVAQNIAFGLKIKKWPKDKMKNRVTELLSLVHMEGLGDRTIDRISGGQQQRVALARALSLEPKVLLLDEPLSNLDANLRVVMREEIRKIQERIQITTVFVTHDQYEAMSISDRILVLNKGIIQQVGSPWDIYQHPANEFIAGFVGYVNFFEGAVKSKNGVTGAALVSTPQGDVEITIERPDVGVGDNIVMIIRPESLKLVPPDQAGTGNLLGGTLESYMYAGSLAKCTVSIGAKKLVVDQYNPAEAIRFEEHEKVGVVIPRKVHVLAKGTFIKL
ncbi:MAG: ABC transporter ATP-binding protein [Thermodesulfobacteriota bacterium]